MGETLNAIVVTVSRGKKRKWRRDDWDWEKELQGKLGKRRTKGKGKETCGKTRRQGRRKESKGREED